MEIIEEKCGNILLNLVELRNRVMGKYISIMCSTLVWSYGKAMCGKIMLCYVIPNMWRFSKKSFLSRVSVM